MTFVMDIFEKHLKKILLVTCFSIFVFGVNAQDLQNNVDRNQDDLVDSGEFIDALQKAGTMARWDSDQDGNFDENEFYVVTQKIWDANSDGMISKDEFDRGTSIFLDDYDLKEKGSFSDWDTDSDQKLNVNEFAQGMKDSEVFSSVDLDQDQKLNQEEATSTVFHIVDEDNDDKIEVIEYGEFMTRLDQDDN
jgi:Ca2+-binding EF-hand superfamily protein